MVYLIDPTNPQGGKCPKLCTLCKTLCWVKPMYGVPV
jgi:hypothetical protein